MQIDVDAIETKTFRRSWRGFNRDDVRAYLREVASMVRDDDHFRRAGVEVATALRRMHELVTTTHTEAVEAAGRLRRQAVIDAEVLLAEAHRRVEQTTADADAEAGTVRFEAAVWATNTRAQAESDRATVQADADKARAAIEQMQEELAEQARGAVAAEIRKRRVRIEKLDDRIHELKTQEVDLVERLHEIENDIGRLVRGPMADVVFVDVPMVGQGGDDRGSDQEVEPSSENQSDANGGVVLDLTGSRLDDAMRAGFQRALNGTDD